MNPGDEPTAPTPDCRQLEEKLGVQFANPELLRLALMHPSATLANESGEIVNNQRLEFLGDAVLQLVLSSELYARLPHATEGVLTKARAQLVNRHALAAQARQLGLGEYLVLSHGEEQNGGRKRPSALADGYEALLGAIFLDGGFEAARAFIQRRFANGLAQMDQTSPQHNPKGELQELLQSQSSESPRYTIASVSGPDHDPIFESVVTHLGTELGRGSGKSKKEAESRAAQAALEHLKTTPIPAQTVTPASGV